MLKGKLSALLQQKSKLLKSILSQFIFIVFGLIALYFWQNYRAIPESHNAPSFNLVSLNGLAYNNNNNDKPNFYYFFAPWCKVCHLSIENLNTIKDKIDHAEINLYIIALDWRHREDVITFVESHDLPANVLLGTEQTKAEFSIKGYPTYFTADKNNQILSASIGYSTAAGIKMRALLQEL